MKKLLLILLLFFPVHGAFAKRVHIKCSTDGTTKTIYPDDSWEEEKDSKNYTFVIDADDLYKRSEEGYETKLKTEFPSYLEDKSVFEILRDKNKPGNQYMFGTLNRRAGSLSINDIFIIPGIAAKLYHGKGKCEKYEGKKGLEDFKF